MHSKKQLLNTLLILIGAALLIYDLVTNTQVVWFKIAGLVLLMSGLYMAMKNWVGENKTEESDEGRGQG